MAVIEICDICKKEVLKRNGIKIKVSDMEGFGPYGHYERNYDIRICECCKDNIIKYCNRYTKDVDKKPSIISKFLEQFDSDSQENN